MNLTKAKFNSISTIAKDNQVVASLIFGPNNGLILELSNEVFKFFDFELEEILTEEEILLNFEILYSSIAVDDFFAQKKLIKIYNVTSKFINVFEKIYPLLEKRKDKIRICLIGEEISAKVKLRTFFENTEDLICACCYFDEKEDALIYSKNFLQSNLIKFEANLPDFIAENLYGDRRILKNELEKLKLIFLDNKNKIITTKDLLEIFENQAIDNVFDFIDYFSIKNKEKASIILNKILESGEISLIGILHLMYRHFQNLFEICSRIENKTSNVDRELFAFFFKRKIFIKKQIEIWKTSEIKQMINFIVSLENANISYSEDFAKQILINKIIKI